ATYGSNSGLVGTTTDENGLATNYFYNSDSFRPSSTYYPNGQAVLYWYYDGLFYDHSYTLVGVQLDLPSTTPRFLYHYQFFDARGALTETYDNYSSANGWSIQDIQYDVMGRAYRTSNPYYCFGYTSCGVNPTGLW